MRITTILQASPLLLGLALGLSAGCGSSVVSGTGGGGTGGSGTAGGSSTSTSTGTGTGTGTSSGSFAACDGPGQCVIVNNGCCDPCGAPDLTTVAAVNTAQADAFHQSICPVQPPCPKCATGLNPNLFAYCDNGTCRAADVSTHEVSACTTSADCTLRYGVGCCEGCGSADVYGLIAVSAKGELAGLVCAEDQACPACVPTYPPEAATICSAGHCQVILAGGGG